MSKFNLLWEYIKEKEEEHLVLSFEEIKNIIGIPIDHSFLNFKKELIEYGYQVKKINRKECSILFEKIK